MLSEIFMKDSSRDYFPFYAKLLFLLCLLPSLNVGKIIHVLADMLDNELDLKSQSPSEAWCRITAGRIQVFRYCESAICPGLPIPDIILCENP